MLVYYFGWVSLLLGWVASNLDNELLIIKKKFLAADYPHKFINSVINTFIEKKNKKEEEYLIPQKFFQIPKPVILIEIPFVWKMR